MDKREIGSMVNYERTKAQIGLSDLAVGLCSVSVLQRLERGERLPDYFVLERIVERLGKSVNKIELLLNEAAYEIYWQRGVIEKNLAERNYTGAADVLEYYQRLPEVKGSLHQQYIGKIQGIITAEGKEEHQAARELFKEALEQTVPGFTLQDLEKYALGESELILLLLWLQEKMETGEYADHMEGKRIIRYIERKCQDEEVLANVYSKADWLFGSMALRRGDRKEALEYTFQGEKLLTDNGLLLHLPQFLDRILLLEDKDSDRHREWKKQRDALKQLYEEYGQNWETGGISLWRIHRQQGIYLLSELVLQERRWLRQSQEKLAEMLDIDQKTVSRLEKGRYRPKEGTFQKLKEYLKIDREMCTTRIVVDDFYLLEMEREITKLNHYRKEEEAERLYKQLKARLSLKWRINRQYVKFMDTLFNRELGRITIQEAIEGCMEAFWVTREGMDLQRIDEIVLGRMEAVIVDYIVRCYNKLDRKKEAIIVLEKLVDGYEKSKVGINFYYSPLALAYQHLAINHEECDNFQEAISWCDRAILLDIKCNRGTGLGFMFLQKIYTMGRREGKQNNQRMYMQAYQILKLTKKEKSCKNLQKVYKKWYGEEIES